MSGATDTLPLRSGPPTSHQFPDHNRSQRQDPTSPPLTPGLGPSSTLSRNASNTGEARPPGAGNNRRRVRGGGRNQADNPKFVFVNYQDPTKDYKAPENRKTIAKYAMVNRKREKIIPTRPPESGGGGGGGSHPANSRSNPTSPTSLHHGPQQPPMNRASSSEETIYQINDHYTPNSDSPGSDASYASFNDFIPANSASPEDTSTFSGITPLPGDVSWLQAPTPSDVGSTSTAALGGFLGSQGTPFQQIDDAFSTDDLDFAQWNDGFSPMAGFENGSQDAQHDLSNFGSDAGAVMRYRPQAISPIQFANSFNLPDPFDSQPISLDRSTDFLIRNYLNAEMLSPNLVKFNPRIVARVKNQRSSLWLPLVQRSASAMAALAAYVYSTLAPEAKSKGFTNSYLGDAIKLVLDDLKHDERKVEDATTYAIVMLMMVAQQQGDMTAYKAHATGLSKVLDERRVALEQNPLRATMTFRRGLSTMTDDGERSLGKCFHCRDATIRQAVAQTTTESSQSTGKGFYDLIDRGLISKGCANFFEQVFTWCKVADQAKVDRLAAAAAAQHAWIDGSEMQWQSLLDLAVTSAVRLTLYLNAWLDWNHSCSAVRGFVHGICGALGACRDLDRYCREAQPAILWICLAAGPFAENEERQWFLRLLRTVASEYSSDAFPHVRRQLLVQFLWNESLTHAAEKFWDDARIGQYVATDMNMTNMNNAFLF